MHNSKCHILHPNASAVLLIYHYRAINACESDRHSLNNTSCIYLYTEWVTGVLLRSYTCGMSYPRSRSTVYLSILASWRMVYTPWEYSSVRQQYHHHHHSVNKFCHWITWQYNVRDIWKSERYLAGCRGVPWTFVPLVGTRNRRMYVMLLSGET